MAHRNPEERRRQFEAVALPFMQALYNTGLRLTSNAEDAGDVVQETYLRAFRTFDNFRPGTNAKAWLFTILYSVVINRREKARREVGPFSVEKLAEVLARRMLAEINEGDAAAPLALEGLAFELLARIHRGRQQDAALDAAPSWLGRVREYLHDNFRSRVRLADLAQVAGVHPDHLSRTFSAVLGTNCGAYQRRLRLEAAMVELAGSDAPFATVAHRCGFSDQSHLTRAVKRATGVTPTAYRAAHRR